MDATLDLTRFLAERFSFRGEGTLSTPALIAHQEFEGLLAGGEDGCDFGPDQALFLPLEPFAYFEPFVF